MVRDPLKPWEIERGQRLGAVLRQARGPARLGEVATAAGISVETLRKIETGRIPTPAFFTVVALARVLGLSLDDDLCLDALHEGVRVKGLVEAATSQLWARRTT